MLNTFLEAVGRGEVKRNNGPVGTTDLRDVVQHVGQQAAQLAARGVDHQQNAAQGDAPRQRQDVMLATQGGTRILKAVTTKTIYTSRMTDLLVPPKVEVKFPQVNFKKLVYPRLQKKVFEIKQRDLLFSIIHGIYQNRANFFLKNQLEDKLCPHPACRRENVTHPQEFGL